MALAGTKGAAIDMRMVLRDAEAKAVLTKLRKQGEDLVGPFKQIVISQHRSTADTFRAQGRPGRWRPLRPATIARRRKGKGGGSPKILQDTGRLRASVTGTGSPGSQVTIRPSMLTIGTNVKYGATHQFGRAPVASAIERVPAHIRKGHKRQGRPVSRAVVRAYTRKVSLRAIPARPYLQWLKGDIQEVIRILRTHLRP